MRKWRKALALVLSAATLAGTLTGCLIVKPSRDNESSPAVPAPDDIWAPYEETVVITTIVEENSGTNFVDGDDYQNNSWYRVEICDAGLDEWRKEALARMFPRLYGAPLSGAALKHGGLPIPPAFCDYQSWQFHIVRCS